MKQIEGLGIELTVKDRTYRVMLEDLTGSETKAFRETVGMSPTQALASGDLDLDVLAGFVWLVRRRTEQHLQYSQVADSISWKELEIEEAHTGATSDSGAGADAPEA